MIMKKRFMLVLVTLMLALGAQAQFEQGTWYFNVSSTGFELSHSDATKTRLALSANVGNFIADNIALIVGTDADFYSGLSEFGVGTQARYYFPTCGVYGGLGVDVRHGFFSFSCEFCIIAQSSRPYRPALSSFRRQEIPRSTSSRSRSHAGRPGSRRTETWASGRCAASRPPGRSAARQPVL